ncbi:MAG: hypothetical protein ABIJ96_16815 [Elusimicrobiota bacterium]
MQITRYFGWLLIPALAVSSLAAQTDEEALLHTGQIPPLDMVHSLDQAKTLSSYLPRCKGSAMRPPYVYTTEYQLSKKDNKEIGRILAALNKFADVSKARAAGYLLGTDFENGMGIPFLNQERIIRGEVDWTRPTILYYIKSRKEPKYSLISAGYYAAGEKPAAGFDAYRKKKTKTPELQWRPFNGACLHVEGGQAGYTLPKDGAAGCKGTFLEKGWLLQLGLPFYNPSGLFAQQNPIADYLDLREREFRFCYE